MADRKTFEISIIKTEEGYESFARTLGVPGLSTDTYDTPLKAFIGIANELEKCGRLVFGRGGS